DGSRSHIIEAVTPMIDCGRYPAKGVVGEPCAVEADIFRDGDNVLRAVVKWRVRGEAGFRESPMTLVDNDRWRGEFPLERNDRYLFTIQAWTDRFASWQRNFAKKAAAGRDVASDLLEGIALIDAVAARAEGEERGALESALAQLRVLAEPREAASIVADEPL